MMYYFETEQISACEYHKEAEVIYKDKKKRCCNWVSREGWVEGKVGSRLSEVWTIGKCP
jgi:hypothetical protein